jgi:hypothetical protein
MEEEDLNENNEGLLDKLRLVEGEYLKRAVALVFHPDPEKYVTGAFIKIAYFKEDASDSLFAEQRIQILDILQDFKNGNLENAKDKINKIMK